MQTTSCLILIQMENEYVSFSPSNPGKIVKVEAVFGSIFGVDESEQTKA